MRCLGVKGYKDIGRANSYVSITQEAGSFFSPDLRGWTIKKEFE